MPVVIMTGYSKNEFYRKGANKDIQCCFLCKRTEIDHSVAFCNGTVINPKIELMSFIVKVIDSDIVAKFLLCNECYLIVSSFCCSGGIQKAMSRKKTPVLD